MKAIHAIILLSVAITAAAQLVLKVGMTSPPVQRLIDQGFSVRLIGIFSDPYVIGGLFLYFGAAMMWFVK